MDRLFLLLAIGSEVIATSLLPATKSMTRPVPTCIMLVGYLCSFYCLARAIQTIPIGVAYAIWSGLGIVLVTIAGYLLYKQELNPLGMMGIATILLGAIMLHLATT